MYYFLVLLIQLMPCGSYSLEEKCIVCVTMEMLMIHNRVNSLIGTNELFGFVFKEGFSCYNNICILET